MENDETKQDAIVPQVLIRTNLDICCYEMILDTSNPTTQTRSGQRFIVGVHFTKFNGNQKEQLAFLFKEMACSIGKFWEELPAESINASQ
jgi:hypothetical protein